MAITLKSVGHFFAKAFTVLKNEIPKVEATESTVEQVTAKIPVYGPLGLTIEKAGYAVLGEIAAVLNAGDAAVKAKLADAGLDINVITTVEDLVKSVPTVAAIAKTL